MGKNNKQVKWYKRRSWRNAIISLAAVIVFATTYALILPASTMTEEAAEADPAVFLEEVAAPVEVVEVVEPAPAEEPAAPAAPAEGDAPAAPAEGDPAAPAEGDPAAPAEGDPAAPAEGDPAAPAEGDPAAPAEGDPAAPAEGDPAAPAEGDPAAPAEGDDEVDPMPARLFELQIGDLIVKVEAPQGAFPTGAKMRLEWVEDEDTLAAIENAVEGAVKSVRAVDIIFLDADDNEIEPLKPIHVSMRSAVVENAESIEIVHVDDKGEAEVVEQKDEETEKDEVTFERDQFSVYAIVETSLTVEWTLPGSSETYVVTVTYGEDALIPEGSSLVVTDYPQGGALYDEMKETLLGEFSLEDNGWFRPDLLEEDYVPPTFSPAGDLALVDISIVAPWGEEIEPAATVSVKIEMKKLPDADTAVLENSMELKHIVGEGENASVEDVANTVNVYGETGGEITVGENSVTAEFDTDSFSLFVFTWGTKNARVIVHYVDVDGNELQGSQTSNITAQNNTTYNFATYNGGITNYTYKEARLSKPNGSVVTGFQTGGNNSSTITFRNGNTSVDTFTVPFNAEVYMVYEPVDYPDGGGGGPGLDAPTTQKLLEPAGDGTYTLSLSVTGTRASQTESNKANVLVIYDTSNSMNTTETAEGGYQPTGGNYGQYGLVNGEYVRLYRQRGTIFNRWYEAVSATGNYNTVYYNTGGNNYTQYTGPRYNYIQGTTTRQAVASAAVKDLAQELLSNNTNLVPDMVEMAFVEFDTIAYRINGGTIASPGAKTTSYATFESWVDNTTIPGPSSSGSNWAGGTDWEDALIQANSFSFGDSDPVYVIFVSDGNPTFRINQNGHNNDGSHNITMNGRAATVYGSGSGDPNNYDLDAAVTAAGAIIQANKHLYSVGCFGDATNMQRLAGAYYDARNQAALNEAFADIVGSITKNLTFANVEINDGLTAMTASTFVSGDVGNFIYYKDGEVWTPEEMAEEGASPATVAVDEETGAQTVVWNLGEDYKLEANVEYKVTFSVWPKQEAYDLLAALNNGLIDWGDPFTYTNSAGETVTIPFSEYESQIILVGSTYTVLTNTDASISYDVVTEQDGQIIDRTPGTAPITNPENGMGLDESHIVVRKVWNDSLDPSQLLSMLEADPDFELVLHVLNDENDYVPVTIKPTLTWTDGHVTAATWPDATVYIAPGVMLNLTAAQAKGIDVTKYTQLTYNGTTYVLLESGHDYTVDEQYSDYHFELAAEIYHPMVVDGTVCNVTFIYNAAGSITGIEAIDSTNTGTLVVTNELRSGANLRKIVVDGEGNEIFPANEIFFLQVSLKDRDGEPILFSAYPGEDATLYFQADGSTASVNIDEDTYPIWFNVYYDAKDDLDLVGTYIPEGQQYYQRSPGMVVQDGGLIAFKPGEVIRIANIPLGTQISFKEVTIPAGYEFVEYDYKEGKATTSWTTVTDIDTGYSLSAIGNQSYYLTFTNEYTAVEVEILKVSAENPDNVLEGAVFTLYEADKTTVIAEGITTDAEGKASLGELSLGTYYLEETAAPSGYNRIAGLIEVNVTADGVTYKQPGNSESQAATLVPSVDDDGTRVYTLTITNSTGATLPKTGGAGTLAYTLGGLFFLSAGLVYAAALRRKGRHSA